MNVYVVNRRAGCSYGDMQEITIVAPDEQRAKELAIKECNDFNEDGLEITKIDLNKEQALTCYFIEG